MQGGYLDRMSEYENDCLEWMQRADQEFLDNHFQHSKKECYYLQQAVDLRARMAQISTGVEQDYHKNKARELNRRIEEIRRIIDPDYLKKKQQNANKKSSGASDSADKKTGKASGGAAADNAGDDDEVKKWFDKENIPKHSFEDVTGMPELKKKLRNVILELNQKSIVEYLGLRSQKAFFFVGPPGCGKTYLIEAFAHELVEMGYNYMPIKGKDILSKYVGDAEKTVDRIFVEAEKHAPCILFVDEIDGVCKNRSLPNLPEYASQITTHFLMGYNRIHSLDVPIIFIGATNYPTQVDNAMLDRVKLFNVPLPDKAGRVLKFQRELSSVLQLANGFSYDEIGDITEIPEEDKRFNYRDIERLCEEIKMMAKEETLSKYSSENMAIDAMRSGEYRITREMFEKARSICPPSPKESILKELEQWSKQFERRQNE